MTEEEIKKLEEDNKLLNEKLQSYEALKDDLQAKKIFDLVYKRFIAFLTFGGILTILAGYVGYNTVVKYMEDQAKNVASRMDSTKVLQIARESIDKKVIPLAIAEVKTRTDIYTDSVLPILIKEVKYITKSYTDSIKPALIKQVSDSSVYSAKSKLNNMETKRVSKGFTDLNIIQNKVYLTILVNDGNIGGCYLQFDDEQTPFAKGEISHLLLGTKEAIKGRHLAVRVTVLNANEKTKKIAITCQFEGIENGIYTYTDSVRNSGDLYILNKEFTFK